MKTIGFTMSILALVSGTPTLSAPKPSDDALGLQALRNFALCAVERTPSGAESLLSYKVGSPDYQKALARYAKGHGYCAPNSRLGFSGMLFAGDLAEALLLERFKNGASLSAAATAANEPKPRTMAEGIGACVTRQRPDAVSALIATEPGSPGELKALQGTNDVLANCIPKGKSMKLNKPAVRAMYALGAYRVLTASATAG